MLLIARLIRTAAGVVAAILATGILLYVLDANEGNDLVGAIMDAARWLAGPFRDMFELSNNEVEVAVNWGIAAVVYLVAAGLLARLLLGASSAGRLRPRRSA